MNFINFPESNMVMGSGGNENTQAIRVIILEHPDYDQDARFYATKFEFDGNEKYQISHDILSAIAQYENDTPEVDKNDDDLLELVKSKLPNLWLKLMHGFVPVSLHVDPPWSMGYKKVILPPKPTDN